MKKLLMIAHDFPPSASVGTLRTLKFVKYLPDYGWQPIILTLKESYYRSVDRSMFFDIKNPKNVYRTYSLEYSRKEDRKTWQNKRKSLYYKTERMVKSIIPAPDDSTGWLPFALVKATHLLRSKDISVIYTTSPPHSVHLTGYLLKKLSKKPWIADFRDPWTSWAPYLYTPPTEIRRKNQEYLEHAVLNCADKVITNTEPMKEDFINKYSDIDKEKYITITNGYDPEEFAQLCVETPQKFTITYTGTLSFVDQNPRYNPKFFLEAVKRLLKEAPFLREKLQIIFVGPGTDTDLASRMIAKLNLEEVVKTIGPVSHKRCIQFLMLSHVLLLIHYSGKGSEAWIPAKIFEYLGAGKPILALAPNKGATADLLKALNAGIIVNPEEPESIKKAVLSLYRGYEEGSLKGPNPSLIQSLSRQRLTGSLATILESLATSEK